MKNNEIRKLLGLNSTQYLSNIKSKEPERYKVLVRHAKLLKKLNDMTPEKLKQWHEDNPLYNTTMNIDIGGLQGLRKTVAKQLMYEEITKKVQ